MPQRTLVLLKPDAVRRRLAGEIIRRFEAKGLRIAGLKMLRFTSDLARRHYAAHVNKSFYPPLEEFIASGPSIALVLEGDDAIDVVRLLMGATSHREAAPGTIRGDLALSTCENLVHGSDGPEAAEREIALFFREDEMF
jgi:nucleoside-diphosphate kinase